MVYHFDTIGVPLRCHWYTIMIPLVHTSMVQKWFIGTKMTSIGTKMVHQWYQNGTPMVSKQYTNGIKMVHQWYQNGTVVHQWYQTGTTPLTLYWQVYR